MATPLQKAVDAAVRLFSTKNISNICNDNLIEIAKHLNCISKSELKLDPRLLDDQIPRQTDPPVTYIRVLDSKILTVCMFIVRQGKRLPLHDHPGMCGLLKVVHGSVVITNYSSLNPASHPVPETVQDTIRNMYGMNSDSFPVSYEGHQTITEDDDCCILTPENRNIHEVTAENGTAAFLDILAPPYDHSDYFDKRPCTYFMATQEGIDNVQYLIPVRPPPDYWCNEVDYCGPPLPSI